jgi:hypothetical protein
MTLWSLNKPEPTEPVASMDAATLKNELSHAYDRGRLRERTRRPAFGVTTLLLALLSATSIFLVGLAAHEGSFAAGGADVDRLIGQAMSSRLG